MSAERLREAAALMRSRAEAARAGRWFADGPEVLAQWEHEARYIGVCDSLSSDGNALNAEHIASWHPAVALAVADWLDRVVGDAEDGIFDQFEDALPIARAYLGADS